MLGAELTPLEYLARCTEEFAKLDLDPLEKLAEEIYAAYEAGRFVFICGNGGSGSNSSHLCEDLGKSTLDPKDFTNDSVKRLKVLSLTDNTPYILAWGNDEGFDRVFVEQLKNFASPGDVLIAISGSGNSAFKAASSAGKNGQSNSARALSSRPSPISRARWMYIMPSRLRIGE